MKDYIPNFLFEEAEVESSGGASTSVSSSFPSSIGDKIKQVVQDSKFSIKDEEDDEQNESSEENESQDESQDSVNLDNLTDEQIEEIQNKDESDLTNEDKEILKALDNKNQDEDKESQDVEDKDIQEILDKEEDDRTDEEKALLEKYENDNQPINVVKSLFNVEEISDNEYENTQEGFQQMVNDVKPLLAEEALETLLESYPPMQALYEHAIKNGRSLDTFLLENQQPNYATFDIKTDDGAEGLLRHSYSQKGLSKEEIDNLVKVAKDSGKIQDKAKDAFKVLDEERKKQVEEAKTNEDKVRQEQIKQNEEAARQFNSVVDARKLLGVNLTKQEAQSLKEYSFRVDEQSGQLQSVVDYNNLSYEEKAFINYLIQKKFKVRGIEAKKITNNSLGNLKQQNKSRSTKTTKTKPESSQNNIFQGKKAGDFFNN